MFTVINILVVELEELDLQDMYARRQISKDAGFKEPSYWDSYEGDTKLRRCIMWKDLYRYGSPSFDPTFREKEEKLSQEMYSIYKELLKSGQEMSETFKQNVSECIEKHEKDTDPDLWK